MGDCSEYDARTTLEEWQAAYAEKLSLPDWSAVLEMLSQSADEDMSTIYQGLSFQCLVARKPYLKGCKIQIVNTTEIVRFIL